MSARAVYDCNIHYVNLAIAVKAKLIISRDRDLLDLMDEKTSDGARFKQRFPEVEILDPLHFIRRLAASSTQP